jgi:hypothetical protein
MKGGGAQETVIDALIVEKKEDIGTAGRRKTSWSLLQHFPAAHGQSTNKDKKLTIMESFNIF